jgi:hypothetical protein
LLGFLKREYKIPKNTKNDVLKLDDLHLKYNLSRFLNSVLQS